MGTILSRDRIWRQRFERLGDERVNKADRPDVGVDCQEPDSAAGQKEPLTEELLAQLLAANELSSFVDNRTTQIPVLSEYLQRLLTEKGLKRSAVINEAGLNPTFGYQIFMGQRRASRDKLLALGLAMGLSLREMNRLLRSGGVNELCAKSRRDAIVVFGVAHGRTLRQVECDLYRFNEQTLGS